MVAALTAQPGAAGCMPLPVPEGAGGASAAHEVGHAQDRFEDVSTPATPPPPRGPWEVLKRAAATTEGKVSGGLMAVVLATGAAPAESPETLAVQLSVMFGAGVFASAFGRVAIDKAMDEGG